ncbi:cyclic nucleotide-binding domain-containing protein [Shimia sp. R11_0]|uniref:N-acyl amino acid synthase FeeM domain-containing protein n=1 Tax=Shimia sp. R11_0 TaxID=2821096 RepID=UPI001AD9AA36|nr:cyclic nucleotide-binding domain-containing protein [Shimia sp. R11_0]MBO9479577.1 cyclic nucleotide-binding domain-containing protein [Shimia sp. R11_0]
MPFRIQHAQDERQIDQVFRLRHQVFCQEEGLLHAEGAQQHLLDKYDAYPSSRLFVALDDADRVIGSVRVTLDNPAGMPADDYFDFRTHAPQNSRFMSVGMLCVAKAHRSAMVANGLLMMCGYFALAKQVDYICVPLNPMLGGVLQRIGAKQLTEDLQAAPNVKEGFLPYLLNVEDMHETYAEFARQNITHNMIESFECMLFEEGEQIIQKDAVGDCAYLIVNGSVAVMHPATSQPLVALSEGDVFGELALFSSDNLRTADVFASSMTRVMVLPKRALLEHIKTSPEAGLNLLSVMSQRMKSVFHHGIGDDAIAAQHSGITL